jgi:hypothetical protein
MDLYERDFLLWTEEQAAALRRAGETRVNAPVDWQHVAEEIEDLGRSQRDAVESLLVQIVIHLLKIGLSPYPDALGHWAKEVRVFRVDVARKLRAAPSLRGKLDLADLYDYARRRALPRIDEAGIAPEDLPMNCPFSLDQLLDEDWWPENRHGLT